MTVLAFAALACRQPTTPPRTAVEDSGTVPTVPVPTSTDPGPTPAHPALTAQPIPPSTILVGDPATEYDQAGHATNGLSLGYTIGLVPAHGSDPGVIFLSHRPTEEEPGNVFIVPGDLPPGTVHYRDHVAGTLDQAFIYDERFGPVADIDQDGDLDVWLLDRMLPGPFLGQDIVFADHTEVTATDAYFFGGGLGGFDADQDGYDDLILDVQSLAVVFYGPFAGPMSALAPEVSVLGTCAAGGRPWYTVLPDLLGPEQDAIGKGGTECNGDTLLYPAHIPRGTHWGDEDAFAENRGADNDKPAPVESLGDLDGDGWQDVVSGTSPGSTAYLGPVTDAIWGLEEAIEWTWKDSVVLIERQVGDVNGDDLPDVLAVINADPDILERPDWDWYVLLLSPLSTTIDPWKDGIPIDRHENYDDIGIYHGDLDGDGLSDLVSQDHGTDSAGYVSIWYARDLLTHAPSLEDR